MRPARTIQYCRTIYKNHITWRDQFPDPHFPRLGQRVLFQSEPYNPTDPAKRSKRGETKSTFPFTFAFIYRMSETDVARSAAEAVDGTTGGVPRVVEMVRDGSDEVKPSDILRYTASLGTRAKISEPGCYVVKCAVSRCSCQRRIIGAAYTHPCCGGYCLCQLFTLLPCCPMIWQYSRTSGAYRSKTTYIGKIDDERDTLACFCIPEGDLAGVDCCPTCCYCYKIGANDTIIWDEDEDSNLTQELV